jgi:hypothetical protein
MGDHPPLKASRTLDLEQNDSGHFLMNETVRNFSWQGLTVTVKDRETKESRDLLNDISGDVQHGVYPCLYYTS